MIRSVRNRAWMTPKADMPMRCTTRGHRRHQGVLDRAFPPFPHDGQAHVVEDGRQERPHERPDQQEHGEASDLALGTVPVRPASLAMNVMASVLTTP